jgi:hypothetical protein
LQRGRATKEANSKQRPLQAQAVLGPEVSSDEESSDHMAPWAEPAITTAATPIRIVKKPAKHSSSLIANPEVDEVRQLHHQSRVAQPLVPTDGSSSSGISGGGMFDRLRVRSEHRRQQDTAIVNDFEAKLSALSEALEVRVLDASYQLRAGLATVDNEVQAAQTQLNKVSHHIEVPCINAVLRAVQFSLLRYRSQCYIHC